MLMTICWQMNLVTALYKLSSNLNFCVGVRFGWDKTSVVCGIRFSNCNWAVDVKSINSRNCCWNHSWVDGFSHDIVGVELTFLKVGRSGLDVRLCDHFLGFSWQGNQLGLHIWCGMRSGVDVFEQHNCLLGRTGGGGGCSGDGDWFILFKRGGWVRFGWGVLRNEVGTRMGWHRCREERGRQGRF